MVFSEHPLQRALVGSFVGVCILCIGLYGNFYGEDLWGVLSDFGCMDPP